ncbi:Transcription factor gsfR2-like protein [Cladobotryum mycophilum]|uniref:Transcription factor gsfR2-like protein n=1 Tax=Cladobotryum mycophilum TaxID=491253 RepID=A0ABR0S5B3_9HYPO
MDSFGSSLNMRRLDRLNGDGAAASRQKSCNACVRGKRRCDKRTPRCTRCAAKNLDCVYQRQPAPPPPPPQHQQSAAPPVSVSSSSTVSGCGGGGSTPEMPDFDMSFDMESLGTDTSPESLQQDVGLQLGDSPELNFSIVDFLSGGNTGLGGGLWDLHGFGDSNKMDIPPVPAPPQQPEQPVRDVSLLTDCDDCVGTVDILQVHDPRSKIGFIVEEFTRLHTTFAQKRATYFMHPRLYTTQLPKAILIAFSAASSYANRTPETKGWAMRVILDAVREVHREGERASTQVDRLARVQALLMLNTIRIFDGDVGMRAAAEREMSVAIAWAKDLAELRNEMEDGLPSSAHITKERLPKSWESWIMLESVRRTVIITFASMCLLYILKNEEAPCELWQDGQSFTASRHLWEAQSSVEFFRAWREKPQYCVTDMGFKEFWLYGRPEDMDDFTKVMLTPQVGLDAIDHFMMGDATIPV